MFAESEGRRREGAIRLRWPGDQASSGDERVLDDEGNDDPGKHFRGGQEIQQDERELLENLRVDCGDIRIEY